MRKALFFTLILIAGHASALEMVVRNISRNSDTSVLMEWDIFEGGGRVANGSVSVNFTPFNATDPVTGLPLSQDQRLDEIRKYFTEYALSYMARFLGGNQDFDKYIQELNGYAVPYQ